MKKLLVALAAALAAVVLSPLPANAVAGAIHGTVTGPGGTPLVGITVDLISDPQDNDPQTVVESTTTGGGGHYSFDLLPGAELFVCFHGPGYLAECNPNAYDRPDGSNSGAETVTSTEAGTVVDAQLAVGGTLTGKVVNEAGVPVKGALATAQATGDGYQYRVTTAADGTFSLGGLPPGDYKTCAYSATLIMRCSADEGGPATYAVSDAGGTQATHDVVLPTFPQGVKVSSASASSIQWSWDATPGATDYRVAISTSSTMSNPVIRTVGNRWVTFSGLKKKTTYYAVVKATNGASTTVGSEKVHQATGAVATPVGAVHDDGAVWTWGPYAGAAKYLVKTKTGASWVGAEQHTLTGTTITLGIDPGSSAQFKVVALNAKGATISTYSQVASAFVPYHPV